MGVNVVEIPARKLVPGNVIRHQAGRGAPKFLRVTDVAMAPKEGSKARKLTITGRGHGKAWEESEKDFTLTVMADHVLKARVKRVRLVITRMGEELVFVRNARVRMADWVRAENADGQVRTVYGAEILRKAWGYRPLVEKSGRG